MKTERNILIAFLLNLFFSIFEFIGGMITGSVSIISDAIHDIGDAFSIGASYLLERKSKKQPDDIFTYGYARYSVLGSAVTTIVLLLGSILVIFKAFQRIFDPIEIDYNGMIIFAVLGVALNFLAVYITHNGDSINQKAINLHMLEDMLGWIIVLIGSIIMRFTDIYILDPIMSIGVAIFILLNSLKILKEFLPLFLERTPRGISVKEIKEHVSEIEGVLDVHHIHIWGIDSFHNYATMHIVSDKDPHIIKERVRKEMTEHGITHVTLELESKDEKCHNDNCEFEYKNTKIHDCHHH